MFLNESSQHFLLFLTKERVSYFLSRFSEKESMAKKEEPEGISISPQTSSESKLTKRSLAEQGFLFYRFVPPLAMQTAGWVCIAETASVFLDLSRAAWKPNANPHYLTNFVCSTDFLQV